MGRGNPNARGADRRVSAVERSIRQQLDAHPGHSIPLMVIACWHAGVPAFWRMFSGGKLRVGPINFEVDQTELTASRKAVRKVVNRLVATGEFKLSYYECWINLPVSLGGIVEDGEWLCVGYQHRPDNS